MKRSLALVLVGVVVVAVVVGVVLSPRGATPTDQAKVREDFQARGGTSVGSDTSTGSDTSADTPAPGIYRYDTSGSEELKLGVLPTETRPYPESITATIVDADPGCFTMTLNLLEQHGEDTTFCVGDGGAISLAGHEKRQQVGPLNPTAAMTCDPDTIADPDRSTAPLTCELTLDGGPAKLNATLRGTSASDPSANVDVDGTPVEATEVDIDFEVTGDLTGTWRERVWFSRKDALPLRITRDLDLKGLAAFTEHRDSTLISLKSEDRSPPGA